MSVRDYSADWYKDAVIYQLHVKAYYDGSGDGVGDFSGLTARLDYLKNLGVDTLWLLPFYPSPLRDDGYDIADYRGVHPAYGTLRDFRSFVRAAHERGLRVITELVVNHTSDQHPWFQRARRARPGSVYRDFYVWSNDDAKYAGTRVIFTDTESSNWTWDPVAGQYYWHRFFSHQPDLNFANPRVFEAIADAMRYWFDAGVDGMRLDAVPYLCEREGTNNENLPETHDVIKRLRRIVDDEYPGRFFLAEANQWPEDVRAYFGDGDECHMAFHFPLMPRMFMAIASGDRYPIYDIMRQTPAIPENCQWAIFLRNHDEMTLEMVTDRERAFMYSVYASDARARVNVGIRRRLAPLMENDRRKIELMTSLLFSMPGTPIVYYGDEIGMGDNIYLGDRDAVRTPMQWSIDRNGGFSRADAQRLYLPIIQDPIYGYSAVNVEAQERSPSSLLNWVKRVIAVRKAHRVFGRGTLTFLYPENRGVLAYLREYEGETVLCVANLADTPQAVELDLTRYTGRIPVEMLGWSSFPTIGTDRYLLTFPRYAFYWFLLSEPAVEAGRALPSILPEFFTLVVREGWRGLMREPARTTLERDVIPTYLPTKRWFAAKNEPITAARLEDVVPLSSAVEPPLLALVGITLDDSRMERYLLSPAFASERSGEYPPAALNGAFARYRSIAREGLVYDVSLDDRFWNACAQALSAETQFSGERGTLFAHGSARFREFAGDAADDIRRVQGEQSNTSAIVAGRIMLKVYRRLQGGVHPEIEMSRFLTRAGYTHTPALLGDMEYIDEHGISTGVAIAHEYVLNQGDGWSVTLEFLKRFLSNTEGVASADASVPPVDPLDVYDDYARILGRRLAEMHRLLAAATGDPAFDPEPVAPQETAAWGAEIEQAWQHAVNALERHVPALGAVQEEARVLIGSKDDVREAIARSAHSGVPAIKTRIHGDFHLGQVLVVEHDILIVDLEGETQAPFEHRRRKQSALRDVAGMMRSFDYAAVASMAELGPDRASELEERGEDVQRWKDRALHAFLQAYQEELGSTIDRALLELFLLGKAVYELEYELANRPTWAHIPIRGLLNILAARE